MISNLLKFLVFVTLCYLAVEQSYRFYSVGWTAFSYAKMNSLTGILNSGLIELSDNPEVYYQLKPNLNAYYKSTELHTNSFGLADKEYSLEKPTGTVRIAVIGSSWSMASGVPTDASYHAVLEDRFNSDAATPTVEFINFSVEYYSLREIVAVVQSKVVAWKPDVIVIPVTYTTASIIWEGITANRELPPRIYPFFASFTLRELNRFGIPWRLPVDPYRAPLGGPGMGLYRAQLIRSLQEVDKVAGQLGAKTVFLWLGFEPLQKKTLAELELLAEDTGIVLMRGDTALQGSKREQERLRVSRFDRHPNELAHRKIADVVGIALRENNLLSVQAEL